jgi:hypothetical protein
MTTKRMAMNESLYPGPPEFIMYPIVQPDPPPIPKSRRGIDIYTSDGVNDKLIGKQDLPDAEPTKYDTLLYNERILDLDAIMSKVPEEFHLAVHNYIGCISQQDYNNDISYIELVWAL